MNTLQKKNEDDYPLDLEAEGYYWSFIDEDFKLIRIKSIEKKTITYTECSLHLDGEKTILSDSVKEKKIIIKEKSYFREFEMNQINPFLDNLSEIANISYPSFLFNLKLKRQLGKFSIRAGKISIGIDLNKLKELDPSDFFEFNNDACYLDNQTVIINGLPNSGKTRLSNKIAEKVFRDFNCEEKQSYLIEAEDILEFFGNAINYREFSDLQNFNLNSSRYMKVLKFYFNNKIIERIKIKHFLFEKNRIILQKEIKETKFNFHAIHSVIEGFYQIFVNNYESEEFNEILCIIKSEYSNLNQKGILKELYQTYNKFDTEIKADSIIIDLNKLYLEKFFKFLCNLKFFSLDNKIILIKILNLLFAILLLNSISLEINDEGKASLEEENKHIEIISKFLKCDKKSLKDRLISREIRSPRGSFYVVKFTYEEAQRTKDNLVKYLYDNLLEFLTRLMNLHLEKEFSRSQNLSKKKDTRFIQLIECFGFENSDDPKENSLENLFINYTNDKLNLLLFDLFIKAETEIYKMEGIVKLQDSTTTSSGGIKASRNRSYSTRNIKSSGLKVNENGLIDFDIESTMTALEDNTKGLFKLIDVQSSLINTSKGGMSNLVQSIQLNWPQLGTTNNSFNLVHFGKEVEYGSEDFIQKNVESVNEDLKCVVKDFFKNIIESLSIEEVSSKYRNYFTYLMKSLEYKEDHSSESSLNNLTGRKSLTTKFHQNMKLKSNTENFLKEIKNLIDKITKYDVKFIKLITQSDSEKQMLRQIYSSGILESLLIAKGGFFIRHNLNDLIKKLKIFRFYFKLEEGNCDENNIAEFVKKMSMLLKIDQKDIVIGKSLFFVKNDSLNKNKELSRSKNLLSYCRKRLLRIELNKILSLSKFLRHMRKNVTRKKLELFIGLIEKVEREKFKKKYLCALRRNLRSKNKIIVLIQRVWRKIQFLKEQKNSAAKKIQKVFKNFRTSQNDKIKEEKNILISDNLFSQINILSNSALKSKNSKRQLGIRKDKTNLINRGKKSENIKPLEISLINNINEINNLKSSEILSTNKACSTPNYLTITSDFISNGYMSLENNTFHSFNDSNSEKYNDRNIKHQQGSNSIAETRLGYQSGDSSSIDIVMNKALNTHCDNTKSQAVQSNIQCIPISSTDIHIHNENLLENFSNQANSQTIINCLISDENDANSYIKNNYKIDENDDNNHISLLEHIEPDHAYFSKEIKSPKSDAIKRDASRKNIETVYTDDIICDAKKNNEQKPLQQENDFQINNYDTSTNQVEFNKKVGIIETITNIDNINSTHIIIDNVETFDPMKAYDSNKEDVSFDKEYLTENHDEINKIKKIQEEPVDGLLNDEEREIIKRSPTQNSYENESGSGNLIFSKFFENLKKLRESFLKKKFFDNLLANEIQFMKKVITIQTSIREIFNTKNERKKEFNNLISNVLIRIEKIELEDKFSKLINRLIIIGGRRELAVRKIQNKFKLVNSNEKLYVKASTKIQNSFRIFFIRKRFTKFNLIVKATIYRRLFSNLLNFITERNYYANKIINLFRSRAQGYKTNEFEKIFYVLRKFSIKLLVKNLKNIFHFHSSLSKNYDDMERVKEFFTIRYAEINLQEDHFPSNKKSRAVYEKKIDEGKFLSSETNSLYDKKLPIKKKSKNLEILKNATANIENELINFNSLIDKCSHELDDLLLHISKDVKK